MRITQIINEDMVIAQEEQTGEAGYWLSRINGKENEMLFAVVENAFGIMERRFGIRSADVSLLTYRRFVEHLRTSVRRTMKEGVRVSATDGTLGQLLRQHLPDCYECACEIQADLEQRSGSAVPEDERLDLMLHVHKVVSNAEPGRKRA